jgi:hypothetical protein
VRAGTRHERGTDPAQEITFGKYFLFLMLVERG